MVNSGEAYLEGFLCRLRLRSALTEEEQQAVLCLPCRLERVRAKKDFVSPGDTVSHASLIVDGLVGRFDQTSDGARQITAIHVPGDMADLHSIVQTRAKSALQALSLATIVRVPHIAFRRAAAAHPALAEALWRDCMVDADILRQWVVNLGRRSAKCRIAHLVCEMAMRLGAEVRTAGACFPLAMTQSQLADVTGLTTVHVNRVLKGFKQDGIAEVGRGEVIIHDWAALKATGDFNADYLQTDVRPDERMRILHAN